MSRLRSTFTALAILGALSGGVATAHASAPAGDSTNGQARTSPPRPPVGGSLPPGSYQRTCRGANMSGNMLSAQCPGPTGAPIYSSIDTNGCRGRDISNDRGYLRCNSGGGGGPRPPEPPRPVPPQPPRPVPPRPPVGNGSFQAVVYTGANYSGRYMTVREPIANLANFSGFNDNIRSIRIIRGRAQVCVDSRYNGHCVTIGRSYRDLHQIGMANRISSIR